ncbi:hypothetical protein [uncultured Sphingomonas sp.]|uniref:hypothetical protein n=1 Tax=uncultured Sphingomonas sp. TaxID=158754 RepID=UPI0035C99EFC
MTGLERSGTDLKVQRAIEGRYLPEARADRRSAQAASKAALQPAPSTVRWNSRPTKADRKRDEAAAAERAARAARATEEDRLLRAAQAAQAERWDHKRHATPATMDAAIENEVCVEARTRSGALARLFNTRSIDAGQLAAAVEIAGVAERIARDVTTKSASYEARVDNGRHGGAAEEKLSQVRREIAYRDWRKAVRGPLGAVLDMIVGDTIGYTVVARRYGMSEHRAKRVLIDALDLWPSVIGRVCRLIDQADLDRAQARLA